MSKLIPAVIRNIEINENVILMMMPVVEGNIAPKHFTLTVHTVIANMGGRPSFRGFIEAVAWLLSHHTNGNRIPITAGSIPPWAESILERARGLLPRGAGADASLLASAISCAIAGEIKSQEVALRQKHESAEAARQLAAATAAAYERRAETEREKFLRRQREKIEAAADAAAADAAAADAAAADAAAADAAAADAAADAAAADAAADAAVAEAVAEAIAEPNRQSMIVEFRRLAFKLGVILTPEQEKILVS